MAETGLFISKDKCVGCKACVRACPFSALEMDGRLAVVNDNCTLCGACVESCKFAAITICKDKPVANDDLSQYQGVWVFGEQIDNKIQPVVYELIGAGRDLASKLGVDLTVVVLGAGLDQVCNDLLDYPVDKVLYIDHPDLKNYSAEPYAEALIAAIKQRKPEIVLAGATAIGRSFLARVAVGVHTGLTADCTGLDITPERLLLQTRPAFGGNIMASILCKNHRPQMATVRHKVMKEAKKDQRRTGAVEKINLANDAVKIRTRRIEFIPELLDTINVAEADIIVSGGRGMGRPESFELLQRLAKRLGGAVGASRAAVDSGWMPYSHQVGQTGKTVQPKLYIACGISGAVQHLVGMQNSDVIVAINKDADAPIMQVANYGLVGDLFAIVPAILRELGE